MRFVGSALVLCAALWGCETKPTPVAALPLAPAPSSSAVAPTPAQPPTALARERRELMVDGVKEQWRIEWTAPPEPACVDENRHGCDCTGFVYGEKGRYDIVRMRPGSPEQRLHLEGILPHWPDLKGDDALFGSGPADLQVIRQRPPVSIMRFDDYDHDGRATEFVLQVDAGKPCMRTWSMLVGVLGGKLRMFPIEGSPNEPLVLGDMWSAWEKVRTQNPAEVTERACGDHNAPVEVRYWIRPGTQGFKVDVRTYECVTVRTPHDHPAPGRLLKQAAWTADIDLFRNRHEGL